MHLDLSLLSLFLSVSFSAFSLKVYECKEEELCPGGDPETCFGGLIDLGCSRCPDGEERTEDGCRSCEDSAGPLSFMFMGCAGASKAFESL